MSVVTAEEFYRDALDVLIEIKDIQEEIRDSMLSSTDILGGGADNITDTVVADVNQAMNPSEVGSIEQMSNGLGSLVSSVNGLEVEKVNAIDKLLSSVDNFSFSEAKASAMDTIANSIANVAEKINDIDIDNASRFPMILGSIGLGLVAFSAGLSASVLMVGWAVMENPVGIIALAGVIALFGLTSSVIGENSRDIMMGSLAIGVMALSLVAFSGALALSSGFITAIDPIGLIATPLLLVGFGLIYDVLGVSAMNIGLGALAVGAIALSLWGLGEAMKVFDEAVDGSYDLFWTIPAMITDLGLTYAAAGVALPFVAAGAGTVALMGGSLWLFSKALKSMSELSDLDIEENTDKVTYSIEKLSEAYATAGSDEGMSKLFGFNVGRNDVERGIDSTMRMGKNLMFLAKGMSAWKDSGITSGELEIIKTNIENVLFTIPAIFSVIGANERGSSNQIKLPNPLGGTFQFSVPFTKTDTELGISATMKLGKNLINLHKGIDVWKKGKVTASDMVTIKENIESVLFTIPSIFSVIGANERGSSNQISIPNPFGGVTKFSVPFTKTDTELGIKSTMGIGKSLLDLHKGIEIWKKGKISEDDMLTIKENIESVLFTIPAIFNVIGSNERGSSNQIALPTPFGTIKFSVPFTKTDTELGIKSTRHIGDTLKSLYDGVFAWRIGGKNDISKDLPSIKQNIIDVLTVIPNAFTEVGKLANEDSYLWGAIDGSMEDGIELVTRMTKPLTELSNVMKVYSSESDFTLGSRNMSRSLISLATSMDYFTPKRIDALDDLNSQFGDLNKNLKEHFKIIKGIPKSELLAFDDYTKSLKLLSEIQAKNLVNGVKSHNQEVTSRQQQQQQQVVQQQQWANASVFTPQQTTRTANVGGTAQAGSSQQQISMMGVERLLSQIYQAVAKDTTIDEVRSIMQQIKVELEQRR